MTFPEFVSHFRGPAIPTKAGGVSVFCPVPAHADGQKRNRQSLNLTPSANGRHRIHCFAGCERATILAAVGLESWDVVPPRLQPMQRRLVETYDYRDEKGVLLFQVCRFEPKDFRQRTPDPAKPGEWVWSLKGVRRVLYRLPELREAAKTSPLGRGWIVLCEGEKDVDRLRALGIPATTCPMGAGKWDDDYFDQLLRANVAGLVLLPDNDSAGRKDKRDVLRRGLESRGFDFKWLELPGLPSKGDVSDWLNQGGTKDQLVELVRALPLVETPLPEPEPGAAAGDPRSKGAGPYRVHDGRICRDKPTRDGVITEALCNFAAYVTEEVVLDDGAEPTRAFVVTGRLDTGEVLPAARVPAGRFSGMTWVPDQWGLRAVVGAGLSTRDYLREAIQRLSPEARARHIYTHTGWREREGRFIYLHATGAIGASDCEVDLGPELARYSLPAAPNDPGPALRASLDLLRTPIAPASLMVPLWAAAYRAPTVSALPVDVSLWLEGVTGSLKSTLAALILAHYGPFERLTLPGNWSSTANQLERRAFLLKDTLFVIDDYAPGALDSRELELKASRMLRAVGNRAGRARLRADLTERAAYAPRGILVVTGECRPPGQGLLARTLVLEVDRTQIDLDALGRAQAQTTQLAVAMTLYLGWLAPQMSTLPGTLAAAFATTRAKATADDPHLRVPEAISHLYLGLDLGLACAHELGACSASEADELRERGWKTLQALSAGQGALIVSETPTHRFLRILITLMTQGRAVLLDREWGDMSVKPDTLLGWQDETSLYLLPDATWHAVARFTREMGESFPVRQERLRRDLEREGLAASDPGRHTATVKVSGKTRRVLRIHRPLAEGILGEAFPSPPVTSVTGAGR